MDNINNFTMGPLPEIDVTETVERVFEKLSSKELSVKQIFHIDTLAKVWVGMMAKKYADGAKEHGGNLWELSEMDLLDQALFENIDQFVYLFTLKQKKLGLL